MMKKNVNSKILNKYFGYQNPSFLANYLIETNQSKNNEIINQTIDSINELKNAVSKKEIPENENQNKIIDIAKKILEFNNQKKGTGIKILTPKQMLQRLPMNSRTLLTEIRQTAYSLYQSKETTKKAYNNIIKSIQTKI